MNVGQLVQFIVNLIAAHPLEAHALIFLISAGEAVFILGLFVPSTPVLLACGTLIGVGKLAFWPVFVSAALGAMAGDAISYWVGHLLEHRIKHIWPFNQHVRLVEQGEAFFHRHGGASVFVGRFIPGVKAVVPGVAGILGMSPLYFTIINCVSALAWAGANLVPAALISGGLARSGWLTPHLLPLIVAAVAILLAAGYAAELWLKRSGGSLFKTVASLAGRKRPDTPPADFNDNDA